MASVYDLLARCIDWATGKAKVDLQVSSVTATDVTIKDPTIETQKLKVNADGSILTQLTGSTVADSQAVPMTQAQKDIGARAIENIISAVGTENIVTLFPFWETSGSVVRSITNRQVTLDVVGATYGAQGPLGPCITCDGNDDYLIQTPLTKNAIVNTGLALTDETQMAAQKLIPSLSAWIGFCVLRLKRVDSPNVTLQVEIVEDSSGQPTGAVVASSTTQTVSWISTTGYSHVGFAFNTPPLLEKNKVYWVRLKFATVTTLDASNYIIWGYDNTGGYGRPRAFYDGTSWTVTADQSYGFELYTDDLGVYDDISVFLLYRVNSSLVTWGTIFESHSGNNVDSTHLALSNYNNQFLRVYVGQGSNSNRKHIPHPTTGLFGTFGFSLSKADSTGQLKTYLNGRPLIAVDGTAGSGLVKQHGPLIIGAMRRADMVEVTNYAAISVALFLLTKNVLTASQFGVLHNYALGLRKFREAL